MTKPYTKELILEAIKDSAGVMSTIASRLQCEWHTAQTYVNKWECTKQAYEAEREKVLDMAESVIYHNIQLAAKQQKNGEMADTGDAKWVLSRLGKQRGFADKVEAEVTGAGGGAIKLYSIVSPDDWTDNDDSGKAE